MYCANDIYYKPGATGWKGRGSMLHATTAAMTVMLLQAIFVPIVHKTSLKSGDGRITLNKPFIFKQLLFLY